MKLQTQCIEFGCFRELAAAVVLHFSLKACQSVKKLSVVRVLLIFARFQHALYFSAAISPSNEIHGATEERVRVMRSSSR